VHLEDVAIQKRAKSQSSHFITKMTEVSHDALVVSHTITLATVLFFYRDNLFHTCVFFGFITHLWVAKKWKVRLKNWPVMVARAQTA
jgi:hypothetical protein